MLLPTVDDLRIGLVVLLLVCVILKLLANPLFVLGLYLLKASYGIIDRTIWQVINYAMVIAAQ
tara:strand:- start:441 stop:629 length:189 start_codon:yes stop_codon:yes gene_type:complete